MNSSRKNISVASLYIGDLHPEATEAMLFEKFSIEGPILSIRVCRDRNTRRSLGYAYINFQNYEDAERVLETKNYDLIKGKPIRIMWCQRDPTLRKSGLGNVFIKNLEKNIDNKAMYNTFSAFGNILSCKIVIDEKGNSKGYGFVHFETEAAANKAISKINGMLLNGKEVYVGKFIPQNQREGYFDFNIRPYTSIFIKNFGDDMNDDKLKELFEKYGTINSVKVVTDENGISKDFGFINFEDTINAVKAIEEMNGKEFNGKCLYVNWAQRKSERENEARQQFEQRKLVKEKYSQGLNLFIKNLDETIDVEHLTKEFLPFGTISSAKVITDENGNSRGFGFVCFNSPEEANRAVAEMNGKILVSKPLYVTLARKKNTRKANMTYRYLESIPELQMQPCYHDQMLHHDNSGYFMPPIPIHHDMPLNQLTVPSRWATEFQKEYYF